MILTLKSFELGLRKELLQILIVRTFTLSANSPILDQISFVFGIATAADCFATTVAGLEPDPGDPLVADFTFRIVHASNRVGFVEIKKYKIEVGNPLLVPF